MTLADKGSYALVLHLPRRRRIRVGRLDLVDFPPGCYIYVGSAFGPGGLRARIAHHMKRAVRPHWHIDYLRRAADVMEVWYVTDKRMECTWAERLQGAKGVTMPVAGFGASDCGCPTHLFRVGDA